MNEAEVPEHKVLRSNYSKIMQGIKTNSQYFCDELYSQEFITDDRRDEVRKPILADADKARKLLDSVLNRVKSHPTEFGKFLDILGAESSTRELAETLRNRLSSYQNDAGSQQQTSLTISSTEDYPETLYYPVSVTTQTSFSLAEATPDVAENSEETKETDHKHPTLVRTTESFDVPESELKLLWEKKGTQNLRLAKSIEGPCGAAASDSVAYFRRYWGNEIYSHDMVTSKWKAECDCGINDTTLVMMPIEFGGEEALHTVGGKLDDGSLVQHLHYYKDGAWNQSNYPPMHFKRQQVGAICYEKKYLIVIGGYGENALKKAIEILDFEKKEWQRASEISFEDPACKVEQVHAMKEVDILRHLAVYGTGPLLDFLENLQYTKNMNIDDIVEKTIVDLESHMPELPQALEKELREKRESLENALFKELGLYRMSVCICEDYLYILGGLTNIHGQSPLRTAFKASLKSLLKTCTRNFDNAPSRKVFVSLRHLPHVHSSFVAYRNRVLAIGGSKPLRNNVCVGDVYEYQPEINEWVKTKGSLCIPRCHCFTIAIGSPDEKLMIFGGRPKNYDNPSTDNSIEIADLELLEATPDTGMQNQPNPGSGLTRKKVIKEMLRALDKWRELLVGLGLDEVFIDETIDGKWKYPIDCLREGVCHWLTSGKRSWKDVVAALSTVGRQDLADQVEQKYLSSAANYEPAAAAVAIDSQ